MNSQNQIRPVFQAPPAVRPSFNPIGSYFAEKNILIITLVILLALSLLGINLLTLLGSGIQSIVNWIGPYITGLLFKVSDTTGAVINKTSDVVSKMLGLTKEQYLLGTVLDFTPNCDKECFYRTSGEPFSYSVFKKKQ